MMEMNNPRTESHVAQKSRRHKLRFQQNSDDSNHQHFHEPHRPRYGSSSYDPNVFPSEMLNSIASNPHLLLPPNHAFVSDDHDSPSGSSPSTNGGNWKNVVNSQNQLQVNSDNWNHVVTNNYSNNVASMISIDHSNSMVVVADGGGGGCNKPCYGYNHEYIVPSVPYNNYQNTLQEFVTATHNQSNNIPCWMNASDQLGFIASSRSNDDEREGTITQGLSLSLSSSVPQPKTEFQNSGQTKAILKTDPKQLMGMSSFAHRSSGPLGPFTGYATILKNSKYLKPAQELLNDNCDVGGQEFCDNTHKVLDEELSRVSGGSGVSSSTVYATNEHINTGRNESCRPPEIHQKKAKLLYMQEEVCRRYKQYHQQMQMVISSFETVAGLNSATPFVSLALKSVSRQFHFVKTAISDQLAQTKKTFEELCSPTVGGSTSKSFDANANDYNHQRHGKSGVGTGFFGNQQPVWRPQRGLPERAVSVLKAWLFDHFLHPYPSDADKHMLATQTGLTRNQVSNWFINARVRIWKPMVEEIHTLETKGLAESNSNNPPTIGQDLSSMANKQQPECSRNSGMLTMIDDQNEQVWDREKWSRPEFQVPAATMDRSFTSMMNYPRTTFEAGGVGPVSLTLGLRQNGEHVQQLQQHEHQLRQRFGGQLIHDFVG